MPEKYFLAILALTDRLRYFIQTEKGEVVYFVVQYETLVNDKWLAVVRFDLAHGFFHKDTLNIKGEQVSKKVINISDKKEALTYAEKEILAKWEFYRNRFLKGAKK